MDARRRDERRMRWIEDRVGQASLSGPFLWGGEMLTASKRRQLAAIPLGLLCALALGLPACAETPKSDDDARYEVDLRGAPLKGASDPKVVLVEFIDIECPYCAVTARNAQTLLGRYPDVLAIAFRHYPLSSVHEYALGAAVAAECADAQSLFWPMLERLVAPDARLHSAALLDHAEATGLDMEAFTACLDSQAPLDEIARDQALAAELGVRATPTMFLNGRRLVGMRTVDEFTSLVEEELARLSQEIAGPDAGETPPGAEGMASASD